MNRNSIFALALIVLTIFASSQAKADVCIRTSQVKKALEDIVKKPCQDIGIADLSAVEALRLVGFGIKTLNKEDFFGLTGVHTLDLRSNKISTLPMGVFDGLINLQELSLGANDLTALPRGIFERLKGLEILFLNNNHLTYLPLGFFDGMAYLQVLDLSSNPLNELPVGVFFGLKGLGTLNLYNIELTSLPVGLFDPLTGLLNLYLHNNHLTSLPPGIFAHLKALRILVLAKNQLTSLTAGSFHGLKMLQELYLNNNRIRVIENGVFEDNSEFCQLNISIDLRANPIDVFPSEKLPRFRNPYQCHFGPLEDTSITTEMFFHAILTRIDLVPPRFTQIESAVPLLERSYIRDYIMTPITAHYGFDLIPTLDGTEAGLHVVRQLAIDVCVLVPSFCQIREEIHQFPRLDHLTATTDLKNKLIGENAPASKIAKVTELERAILQMFSRNIDYQSLRNRLPDGDLRQHLDQLFSQTSWTFKEIADTSQKIQTELMKAHDDAWNAAHFIAIFKIKSFLIYTFKKNFWNQPVEGLLDAKTIHSLVEMSRSVALLSDREAQYLRTAIDRGDDLKSVIEKSVQWQLKNLEREHFSQVSNPIYTPVQPQFPDPKEMLEPLYQKIVRTSMIAEWDRLH